MRMTDNEIIKEYERIHSEFKYNELFVKIVSDILGTDTVLPKRYIVESLKENETVFDLESSIDDVLETYDTGIAYAENEQEAVGRYILNISFHDFEDYMSEDFAHRTIQGLGEENEEHYHVYKTHEGEYIVISKYF